MEVDKHCTFAVSDRANAEGECFCAIMSQGHYTVFNYYVEKREHHTLISDVNVNMTFSKTEKDMNTKKEQHIPLISHYFSKKADLN